MDYEQQYEHELAERYSSHPLIWALYGAIFGSVTTFLLDPQKGRRRRALLKDKGVHFSKISNRFVSHKMAHFRNIFQGLQAQARNRSKDRNIQTEDSVGADF